MTKNWVLTLQATQCIDGYDAILNASCYDRIEPQNFWLWQPAQMLTNSIGDAAYHNRFGLLFWDFEHNLNMFLKI